MNDVSLDMTALRPVRFTVDEFIRMNTDGLFDRFAKTELIEGEVFAVNAQHRRHSRIKNELVERIRLVLRRIAPHLSALSEVSVALPPDTMPEPDIVILADDGGDGPVAAASTKLIVEIADTTLASDLGAKAALYAAAGIAEYWVVDVESRRIHRRLEPSSGRYLMSDTWPFGAAITAATIPGLTIHTAGL